MKKNPQICGIYPIKKELYVLWIENLGNLLLAKNQNRKLEDIKAIYYWLKEEVIKSKSMLLRKHETQDFDTVNCMRVEP